MRRTTSTALTMLAAALLLVGSSPAVSHEHEVTTCVRQTGCAWAITHGGNGVAYDSVFSSDGRLLFVTGIEYGQLDRTVAFGARSGALVWEHRGPCKQSELPSLALAPDGRRLFGMSSCPFDAARGWSAIAYEPATGTVLWQARIPGGGRPVGAHVSPDAATIFVLVDDGDDGLRLTALDAASGAVRWERTRTGRLAYPPQQLAIDPSGERLYVTAKNAAGVLAMAFDAADGAQLWESLQVGLSADGASGAIAVDPRSSQVFVIGLSRPPPRPGYTVDVVQITAHDAATGAQRWTREWSGSGQVWMPFRRGTLAVSPDGGRLFATWEHYREGVLGTYAYSTATGETVWEDEFHLGPDVAGLAAHPNGRVLYVAGGVGRYDIRALSADTGRTVWLSEYDKIIATDDVTPFGGVARAMLVPMSADGTSVAVVGWRDRSSAVRPWLIVMYQPDLAS